MIPLCAICMTASGRFCYLRQNSQKERSAFLKNQRVFIGFGNFQGSCHCEHPFEIGCAAIWSFLRFMSFTPENVVLGELGVLVP